MIAKVNPLVTMDRARPRRSGPPGRCVCTEGFMIAGLLPTLARDLNVLGAEQHVPPDDVGVVMRVMAGLAMQPVHVRRLKMSPTARGTRMFA